MNASEVMTLLRVKYAPPSWALLQEVRDGNGYSTAGRLMDAMAFGLWPSRGLEIHGFEIKSYRNDWQRELKQPEKAESFYKFVDRWWIVAGDDSVVKVDELPKPWGLLVAKGNKLRTVVEAPIKKATPVSRMFMMAIIRRVSEAYIARGVFDQAVADSVAEKVAKTVENAGRDRVAVVQELDGLRERLRVFEEKSGITIQGYRDATKIGEAVELVLRHGPESIIDQYGYLGRRMKELGDAIAKATDDAREALGKLKVEA